MFHTLEIADFSHWLSELDTSVNDVFVRMLGMTCSPVDTSIATEESLKVTIGVTGRIHTTCSLYFDLSAAQRAVTALAGEEMIDWESVANDAIGEIGNMIVGSLKTKADAGHPASIMSSPAVSRESGPRHSPAMGSSCRRVYLFVGNIMQIEFTAPEFAKAA